MPVSCGQGLSQRRSSPHLQRPFDSPRKVSHESAVSGTTSSSAAEAKANMTSVPLSPAADAIAESTCARARAHARLLVRTALDRCSRFYAHVPLVMAFSLNLRERDATQAGAGAWAAEYLGTNFENSGPALSGPILSNSHLNSHLQYQLFDNTGFHM